MIKDNIDSVCFISRITEINEIPGADKIVQAKIYDWSTIIGKDQFKVNDLVICCTQDAVIPLELSTDLNIISYLRKKSRVRTIKMKGVYSECLLLDIKQFDFPSLEYEGKDMQSILGIFKYEEPEIEVLPKVKRVYFRWNKIHKFGMWKGFFNYKYYQFKSSLTKVKNNPDFAVYFKFPNIKNAPDVFKDIDMVQVQRKIHGSNFRCMMNSKFEYYVGSHRVIKGVKIKHNFIKEFFIKLFIKKNGFYNTDIWSEMSIKYDLENKLKDYLNKVQTYNSEVINTIELYGEVYGERVQGDYSYNLNHRECKFFDIEINNKYIAPWEVENICTIINLPFINVYEKSISYKEFKEKIDFYLNKFIPNTKIPEEGIVLKDVNQQEKTLKAVKIINPLYLLYADKNNISDFH